MAWYVVFRGRKPGVYRDWQSCNDQVSGFPGCSFRSYRTHEEANAAYAAYYGMENASGSEYEGAVQVVPAAPATVVLVPAAPGQAAGIQNVPGGVPAAAEADIVPILVILVAMLVAVIGYLAN